MQEGGIDKGRCDDWRQVRMQEEVATMAGRDDLRKDARIGGTPDANMDRNGKDALAWYMRKA